MEHILSRRILATRRGTVLLGAAAAVLAALLLLVYLNSYRQSLNTSAAPTTVLVATKLIPRGTSAAVISGTGLMQPVTVARDQAKEGAVIDPATLKGRVATTDIVQGQQLTLADFSATTTDAVPTRILGIQRALAIPFDGTRGMVGFVQAGDHVDIYAGFYKGNGPAVLKLLLPNVLVLSAPGVGGGGGIGGTASSSFVFRVFGAQAAKLAFASDNGTLWIVARPTNGAKPVLPGAMTEQRILRSRG